MKVLESFLISLGLQVDEKSFQKADSAFSGLTRSALQLGAVFASKLAIDKVVGDFKNAGTQLDNFNRLTGLSTQNVQALGQAFTAMGGNADDAMGTYLKIQDLMKSPMTGKIEWAAEASKYGFDPNLVIDPNKARSTSEALANIAGGLEKLPMLQKRLAAQAMGFSDDEIRILMRGREEVAKLADPMGKLGIMTQQQVEDAARLTKATGELNLVFSDMGNTIAGELAPALADMAEDFVDFYRANKDLVDSGLETFFGTLADNIQLVSVALALMGGSSALRGIAALRGLIMAGGAAGAAGAGAGAAGAAGAGAAAAAGVSAFTVAATGAAAALYSSSLNENEDQELLNNKLRKGGAMAADAVIDFFRAKGWTEEQAMGIAANLQQESGFRHDAVGDGGDAYGIAQWHKDRQENFRRFSGKSIRESTPAEQLEFVNYELTKGAEKSAGDRLRMTDNAYDAAATVSQYYERPADREGEAQRRGQLAQSYPGSVPIVDQSDPEAWNRAKQQAAQAQQEEQHQEESRPGLWDRLDAWAKSQRRDTEQAPQLQPQQQAPSNYTVNAVVQPQQAPPPQQKKSDAPAATPQAPIYDNRQFHIHGADTNKVEQLYNEKLSRMIDQTRDAFGSPEK